MSWDFKPEWVIEQLSSPCSLLGDRRPFCPGHPNLKVQTHQQKEYLGENHRTLIRHVGKSSPHKLPRPQIWTVCSLVWTLQRKHINVIFFFLWIFFFPLQVFNLSLQMKCAAEKKMLITQLLHSAPAAEKCMTICPGLDGAASSKTWMSLKWW